MRAFDKQVADAVWSLIEAHIPEHVDNHPKGGHRPRISDRVVFHVILVRLVTGCSWTTAEALCGWVVSDTTVRMRRNEWIAAGVFKNIEDEALAAYDRIIGLNLEDIAIDGSLHKAPAGGPGTGPNPTDRGRCGHKWSLVTDTDGIPLGWALDGANRHDIPMLAPTLDALEKRGLHLDVGTVHLDKGYDARTVRDLLDERGYHDAVIAKKRKKGDSIPAPTKEGTHTLGLRWPVERTNSWFANHGQLRRNTDRHTTHRDAQMSLAMVFILTAKLVDYANRWSPKT